MYARVTKFYGYPEKQEEGQERLEGIIDQIAQIPGLQYWFATSDAETGEGFGVAIYDTKESAAAAAETVKAMMSGMEDLFLKPPEVYEHEVDAHIVNA